MTKVGIYNSVTGPSPGVSSWQQLGAQTVPALVGWTGWGAYLRWQPSQVRVMSRIQPWAVIRQSDISSVRAASGWQGHTTGPLNTIRPVAAPAAQATLSQSKANLLSLLNQFGFSNG
jgi:hypothetical protein